MTDHTIEALARLNSLGGGQNGAPFSIDKGYQSDDADASYDAKGFDAIVYDEKDNGLWWAGSEWLQRTQTIENAVAEDSTDWVHMVITYDSYNDLVTLYRNGVQYGDSYTPDSGTIGSNFLTFDPTDSTAGARPMLCARHTGGNKQFAGDVDYAAVYDRALSADEVAVLYEQGPHVPFERSQCKDDIVYSNSDVITPVYPDPETLALIPITNSMTFKFDVVITSACGTSWCCVFYVGTDGSDSANYNSRYPGVWLSGSGMTSGTLHICFTTERTGTDWYCADVGPQDGLVLGKQYTIEIAITQSTRTISFNGEVVYYQGNKPNHCISGGTCSLRSGAVPAEGLPLKIGSDQYTALTGVVSNILIRSTCEVCQTLCNDPEWVVIATEARGTTKANAGDQFRFLDFQDEIYDNYPLCNIKQYKLEYGSSFENSVVFELESEHYVFEDSLQSIDLSLPITIISSTESAFSEGDSAWFCKACASDSSTRFGDTCWGVIVASDENRQCGCNSSPWHGKGLFYGGNSDANQCGAHGGAFSGFTTYGGQKGGLASIGLRLSIMVCNQDILECDAAGSALDWDALTTNGDGIPEMDYSITIDEDDLSLHIQVELEYMGLTSADNEDELWGSTYVLDFEDFDAHKDSIDAPGTCQNRLADSFTSVDFADWWLYSETRPETYVGTDDYLAYPPTDEDMWTVSMAEDDNGIGCTTVVYDGHFTWNELVGCQSSDGSVDYISTVDGERFINLTGVFYVNFVSPFDYKSDSGYYRVYQLLSVPFTIAISKTVNVIGAAGINVMTMSVIAVYKEGEMNTFKLIFLTESSDYLKLTVDTDSGNYLVDMYDGSGYADSVIQSGDFTILDTSVTSGETLTDTPAGCLNNKAFICSQLWEISAILTEDECETKGIDFSGTYTLQFGTACRESPDIDSELADYCGVWLDEHPDIDAGVALQADLTWRDEVCDPELFKVQFAADMYFYTDASYTEAMDDALFQAGEDTVYVEIISGFPSDTYNVFDTVLTDVWLCTFDPLITPADPHDNPLDGGCFAAERDEYDEGEESDYFYHIYDDDQGTEEEDFELEGSDGHPDSTDDTKDQLRFKFLVPQKIARDKLYVHAEVVVELQSEDRRRLLSQRGRSKKRRKTASSRAADLAAKRKAILAREKAASKAAAKSKSPGAHTANQISHFIGSIGLGSGVEHKPQPQPQPQEPQPRNNYHDYPQQPVNAPNATWTGR
eukprot:455010_1